MSSSNSCGKTPEKEIPGKPQSLFVLFSFFCNWYWYFLLYSDESSFDQSKQLSENALASKKRIDKAKRSEKNKMYYEKRKETILQKRKVHYESHAESILKNKKEKYKSQAKSILESKKEHYESHAESIFER